MRGGAEPLSLLPLLTPSLLLLPLPRSPPDSLVEITPIPLPPTRLEPQGFNHPSYLAPGISLLPATPFTSTSTPPNHHPPLSSHRGYRTARARHGSHIGAWYYEITVHHLGETGAVRVGWQKPEGELQAPVGYDHHGVAYNSAKGHKYRAALRLPYQDPDLGYGEGDTVGCLLYLPDAGQAPRRPQIAAYGSIPVLITNPNAERKNHHHTMTEDHPHGITATAPMGLVPGSFVAYTLNGKSLGVAHVGLSEGLWHPAVSLFTKPLITTTERGPEGDGYDLDLTNPTTCTRSIPSGTGTGTGADPSTYAPGIDRRVGAMQGAPAVVEVRFDDFVHTPPALGPLVAQARKMARREGLPVLGDDAGQGPPGDEGEVVGEGRMVVRPAKDMVGES